MLTDVIVRTFSLIMTILIPDTVQNTVWHRISVFRPGLRESIYQNLKKGQRVLVQGRIGYLERKDPNDETIVNRTVSIVAHEVVLFSQQWAVLYTCT